MRHERRAAIVVEASGNRRSAWVGVLGCLAVACSGTPESVSPNSGGFSGVGGGGAGAAQGGGGSAGIGGGGSPPDGGGGAASNTTTRKRIFHLKNGDLGQIRDANDTRTGLEVADAECTTAGQTYGGANWKAWLSSSTVNALDRIADVGPWYRLDQTTLLFADRASIVNGPQVPISPQSVLVDDTRNLFWTGTLVDGTASANNCQDWTDYVFANPLNIATVGRVDTAGPGWVNPTPLSCSYYLALLCIEQ